MNTQETNEQHIINLLESQKTVQPPEALLRATLDKLPHANPIKSPYFSMIQKIALASIAVVVFATGGIFFTQSHSTSTNSSSTSNAALQQDMNAVDQQMNGLNIDTANVDQALNSQSV